MQQIYAPNLHVCPYPSLCTIVVPWHHGTVEDCQKLNHPIHPITHLLHTSLSAVRQYIETYQQ